MRQHARPARSESKRDLAKKNCLQQLFLIFQALQQGYDALQIAATSLTHKQKLKDAVTLQQQAWLFLPTRYMDLPLVFLDRLNEHFVQRQRTLVSQKERR